MTDDETMAALRAVATLLAATNPHVDDLGCFFCLALPTNRHSDNCAWWMAVKVTHAP